MAHIRSTTPLLASLLFALACDAASSSTAASGETKTASAAPAAAKPAPTESKPAPAAVEIVDYDLTSADPEWAGWTAKAPKGAQIMADGVKGARIAGNGRDGFDLNFDPKHKDLKELKKNLETGAAASKGEMKITFTKDTADALEWTSVGYGATTYSFVHLMKVGGRDVSCGNNFMVGIRDEALLKQHVDACKSLAKK